MTPGRERAVLLGVLGAMVVAVAGALARRRLGSVASAEAVAEPPQTYTCQCGREYRTSGMGRHRVYWPANAPEGEPVLGDECPGCGARLPAQPERAVA
jgi:hypothetical protein